MKASRMCDIVIRKAMVFRRTSSANTGANDAVTRDVWRAFRDLQLLGDLRLLRDLRLF